MWVPALGQALSVPILIALLLWPAGDVIALPGWLARTGILELGAHSVGRDLDRARAGETF